MRWGLLNMASLTVVVVEREEGAACAQLSGRWKSEPWVLRDAGRVVGAARAPSPLLSLRAYLLATLANILPEKLRDVRTR